MNTPLQVEQAKEILDGRIRDGARLKVAFHGDLGSVKNHLAACLAEGIPALLGPCSSGG